MSVKKKLLAAMLSGTMLTMALAGCGNGQTAEESEAVPIGTEQESADEVTGDAEDELESGKVELTVWAEENNFEVLEKMFESFKEEYAGQAEFEITLVVQSDAETKNALLGDVHNAADVFSMADDQLLGMVAAGALAPVPNAAEISSANLEDSVAAATYKDVLYAYPYTADNGYFLYYDKNYFTEEDVKTLDGVLAVAEASGKKVSMEFNSGWYLYTFFGGTGMEFGINEDGVTNYCNWNTTEGAIKGTDVAESLVNIASSPAFISQSDGLFVEGVESGEVIAGISGVWNAVAIREAWGDDYGACKLPTYTCAGQQVQMASFKGYKMMGVNAYSDHVEWAHKLADWITNEENQTLRFEERSQGPSNINAASSDAVNKVPAIAAVIDQSQYGSLQRVGNLYWGACTDFADKILAGNPSGESLQELMDTLVAEITASTVQ